MRAAKVDDNQTEIVKALRAIGCKVQHLHRIGEGCPDLMIGIKGRIGLIEIKDGNKPPSARSLTDAQIEWWQEWGPEGANVPLALLTDVEGALRFARILASTA